MKGQFKVNSADSYFCALGANGLKNSVLHFSASGQVTTDGGDVNLWDDCFADLAEIVTNTGHVHIGNLCGTAKIVIKNQVAVLYSAKAL